MERKHGSPSPLILARLIELVVLLQFWLAPKQVRALAKRIRIVRQMLTGSFVLALLGGMLGLFLASWGTQALIALIPSGTIPPALEIGMDARVLFFGLGVSMLTALIFGLWPAVQVSRPQL